MGEALVGISTLTAAFDGVGRQTPTKASMAMWAPRSLTKLMLDVGHIPHGCSGAHIAPSDRRLAPDGGCLLPQREAAHHHAGVDRALRGSEGWRPRESSD